MKHGLVAILDAHGPALHALLLRLTLRQDVADDLLQELFVKLVRSHSFRAAANPIAYVKRTAINLALDWRRRARKDHTAIADVDAVSSDPTVLDALIDREGVERILDASTALSERSRQALVMRCVQQESFDEIGAAMGKTAHQARGLYHAAIAELRSRLRERMSRP